MRRLSLLLLLIPLLTGCKVASPASRMGEAGLAVPSLWSATREARAGVDDDWVAHMGSAQLKALVAEALAYNPDLKIAAARVDQARTLVKSALGVMRPSLEAESTGDRSQRNFVGLPLPGAGNGILTSQSEQFGLNFTANWELDVWGRYRAGAGAAVANAQSAEQDARAARAAIAAQTARAWFALLEANEQVDLAVDAIRILEQTEDSLLQNFRTGAGAEMPNLSAQLRLARSDVAAARAALAQREEAQGQAARALEILLGRYPRGDRRRGERLPVLTATPPAGLPSELLLRRPDILAAERRFATQGMRQKEARRAVWPSLKLTASAGASSSALRDVLNSDFGIWSLGARVFEPILSGGRIQAEITKRNAEEAEALAALQKTVLAAFGEVENALEAGQHLRIREAALAEATRLASEADAAAREVFRGGAGDGGAAALTVLASQQRVVQSRSALATIRRLRLDNRVALHLALGGDFSAH